MDDRRKRHVSWVVIGTLSICVPVAWIVLRPDPIDDADAGELTEITYRRPDDVPRLDLADSTLRWNLSRVAGRAAAIDASSGGLALADVDLDGDLDLFVAHGALEVRLWDGATFGEQVPIDIGINDAVAIDVADVDGDAWPDLLVARSGPTDVIVWGGDWMAHDGRPDTTALEGSQPSAALQAAELSGDDRIDLVRLGRGSDSGEPDVLWVADDVTERSFTRTELGSDRRLSLSAEIFDADLDGLNDVWVTRDLGWATGPDSVYSRRSDPQGEFVDVAEDLGANLAIDGMGITVADLNGDAVLDAYVSDLGDNEVLIRSDELYLATSDTGAARIRAPGAPETVISSSWASGSIDVNLDGRLDLVVVNGGFADVAMRNKVAGTDVSVTDQPAILLGLGDGRYADGWPELGFDWNTSGRGLTIGDIDGDGDDDFVILSDDGTLRAFENRSTAQSVSVSVAGSCDTSGATVTVVSDDRIFQSLVRRHTYNGAHSPQLAIGVNGALSEVSVEWPDGRLETPVVIAEDGGRERRVATCPML